MEVKCFSLKVLEAEKKGMDEADKVMGEAMDYYVNKIMGALSPIPEPDLFFAIAAIREIDEIFSEDSDASEHADLLRKMFGVRVTQVRSCSKNAFLYKEKIFMPGEEK